MAQAFLDVLDLIAKLLWSVQIVYLCMGIFIIALLAFIALLLRSRIVGVLALIATVFLAWYIHPWETFSPKDDPAWQELFSSLRYAQISWFAASTAAVMCAVWVFRYHSRTRNPRHSAL